MKSKLTAHFVTVIFPKPILPCLFLLASVFQARSAEWQWSVEVKSEHPENGPARAFLWIPPDCQRGHGVVVAQHNMEEISIFENPKFREALAKVNFPEAWGCPFFDHPFRFKAGQSDTF